MAHSHSAYALWLFGLHGYHDNAFAAATATFPTFLDTSDQSFINLDSTQ
jgi:hypothetical protein